MSDEFDWKALDPKKLTLAECLDAREALILVGASIDAQLEQATARPEVDPDWVRRARFARKSIGTKIQRVQNQISALRRQETARNIQLANARREADCERFVEAAKEMLDEATYQAIWRRVNGDERPMGPTSRFQSFRLARQGWDAIWRTR